MPPDPPTVLEQIEELLTAPARGAGAPTLARIEDTLTDGYAQALALEAERWRLEQRLGEVARDAAREDVAGSAAELVALSERISTAEGELTRLRSLLGPLHDRARAVRATAC